MLKNITMFIKRHSLLAGGLLSLLTGASANAGYEVWAADQSNTSPGQPSLGIKGGFLWIFDSDDIEIQLATGVDAKPLSCTPSAAEGPCNMLDVFPQNLQRFTHNGEALVATGETLGDLPGFGRLHGVIRDAQGKYVNVNFFAPSGGYVGVIDVKTKEAVGLFRVTEFYFDPLASQGRSVHMSFWTASGDAIVVSNLNGKAVERINVSRDNDGKITNLSFDRSATLGLGKNMVVKEEATVFHGINALGRPMIGEIIGTYDEAGLGDLTPNGFCKENECGEGGGDGSMGGRANNLPICPIPSSNNLLYITLAGGGQFVGDISSTPMSIVGEYGRNAVFGAGCGGAQVGNTMFLDTGVSASGAGATQSHFAVFAFDDSAYLGHANAENEPEVVVVYQDEGSTRTLGNIFGTKTQDTTGQIPGVTTRRDSHGAWITTNGKYLHVDDRIQNKVEVFDTSSYQHFTYDLTSKSGQSGAQGPRGACMDRSVTDDADLPKNDPAPDLFEVTPDGKYMMMALRGPAPVSVPHAAQGSCPGIGIVELYGNGKFGRLVDVLRTTNEIPDAAVISPTSFPGGVQYKGSERSDVHGTIVIPK